MTRLLSGFVPLLVFCSAYAADAKDVPIPTEMNMVGIAIFFILFVGMCVGFFVWMWWKNKHDKEAQKQ